MTMDSEQHVASLMELETYAEQKEILPRNLGILLENSGSGEEVVLVDLLIRSEYIGLPTLADIQKEASENSGLKGIPRNEILVMVGKVSDSGKENRIVAVPGTSKLLGAKKGNFMFLKRVSRYGKTIH